MDCGYDGISTVVVSGDDRPPVFEFCKHVFDEATLLIQMPVVKCVDFRLFFGRIQAVILRAVRDFLILLLS